VDRILCDAVWNIVSVSVASLFRSDWLGRLYKELEISGIHEVSIKHKHNLINHLQRMDIRLPKHALNYQPRGRRERGHPKKRRQRFDAGTGQTT
jgi:hypothetical protein